ncbi:DUF4157 domain-containing protein [Deinococcus ficus]|uniref:eCIS core domain-containing protein n=1 Tax=Deinococcus ficus TaxID=317577 RepID=A0A221SSM2_9DEIO|nr:DUF4157 domain-containing protein [Deinococcus ficus]ASN79639.1 hypothetical protein DFI_00245 [Deinococcus ficus]
MEYQRKRPLTPSAGPHQPTVRAEVPAVSHHVPVQRAMQRFTCTPTAAQRQAVIPVLRAASLHRQEEEHLSAQRLPLQRQVTDLSATLPADAIQTALQRQASERTPGVIPSHPQAAGEWVTVMRHRAEQVDGTRMDARSMQAFATLQRQVAAALVHSVKHDPSPALQRHSAFAEHAVSLQRHALTRTIPRAALSQLPPGERLSLQRAVDEATQADALQRQQDAQALQLHSLQRHLAELDEQATKPVMERIQARRGSGNPLPAAVQRHLEQGLNHDLSAVRIHDDAEADKLAKGVSAVAFTTGTDIYFRSGKFNPNTQSGLELLAHEVTHTVQQSQGKVGKGIDPDAGLEAEARAMGKRLASGSPALKWQSSGGRLRQSVPSATYSVQRTPEGTTDLRKKLVQVAATAQAEARKANAGRGAVAEIGQTPKLNAYEFQPLLPLNKGDPKDLAFDHGFLAGAGGKLDKSKMVKPTLQDYAAWTKWMHIAGALLGLRPDLKDAIFAYMHFLRAGGQARNVNYERFLKYDPAGKRVHDALTEDVKFGIRNSLAGGNYKQGLKYSMSGSTATIYVGRGARYPEPATENWQKAIGKHQAWADVSYNFIYKKSGPTLINTSIHIKMKDMYNFNPGDADIATSTPDDVNGRFELTGLGKEYINYGSVKKNVAFTIDFASLSITQKSAAGSAKLLLPNPR